MTYSPLSLSRRHVLGDLYGRCDPLAESVPVYLAGLEEPELLGHVDQSLGHFADALTFHIADDYCKKLSAGHYTYSFDYKFSDPTKDGPRGRVVLTSIILTGRKGYQKPEPRRASRIVN
jgi:hypothetical protein